MITPPQSSNKFGYCSVICGDSSVVRTTQREAICIMHDLWLPYLVVCHVDDASGRGPSLTYCREVQSWYKIMPISFRLKVERSGLEMIAEEFLGDKV